jgi:DedD protein
MWAVQLGSFSNQENAERLASALRDQGYAAFLSQLKTDAGPLHRVRIGPQEDRESAEAVAAQLARSGHDGQIVPHP